LGCEPAIYLLQVGFETKNSAWDANQPSTFFKWDSKQKFQLGMRTSQLPSPSGIRNKNFSLGCEPAIYLLQVENFFFVQLGMRTSHLPSPSGKLTSHPTPVTTESTAWYNEPVENGCDFRTY
jgi:hypothetical protein